MPTSSLIFVVIVAIWAAFLVQHFVRRRESAAATRLADRFSDDMRVLDPRSAVTQVVAADAGATTRHQSPLVARRGGAASTVNAAVTTAVDTAADIADGTNAAINADPSVTTEGNDHDEVHTMPTAPGSEPAPSRARAPRGAPARSGASIGQRRLRAVLLLVAMLWVPVSVTLAVTKVLLWISVPFALLTVAAVLVWLRAEARADRARAAHAARVAHDRHASNRRHHPHRDQHRDYLNNLLHDQRHDPMQASVDSSYSPVEMPVLSSDDTQVIRDPGRIAEAVEAAVADPAHAPGTVAAQASSAAYGQIDEASDPRDAVFDLVAAAAADEAAHPKPAFEAAEGTWSPVPVPAPTYTMKAKAEPRFTESGIPADVFDTPEFADEADELDDRALFARRAASQ